MLTNFQTRILKTISSGGRDGSTGCVYQGKSKLAALMGDEFFTTIAGKVVLDFGCGEGAEAIEMAQRGASRVIGIDIREDVLQVAKKRALDARVQDICVFATSTKE